MLDSAARPRHILYCGTSFLGRDCPQNLAVAFRYAPKQYRVWRFLCACGGLERVVTSISVLDNREPFLRDRQRNHGTRVVVRCHEPSRAQQATTKPSYCRCRLS